LASVDEALEEVKFPPIKARDNIQIAPGAFKLKYSLNKSMFKKVPRKGVPKTPG